MNTFNTGLKWSDFNLDAENEFWDDEVELNENLVYYNHHGDLIFLRQIKNHILWSC